MSYAAAGSWTSTYVRVTEMAYPAGGVIRIFKGSFPDLKMPRPMLGERVLDVGCGEVATCRCSIRSGWGVLAWRSPTRLVQACARMDGWVFRRTSAPATPAAYRSPAEPSITC